MQNTKNCGRYLRFKMGVCAVLFGCMGFEFLWANDPLGDAGEAARSGVRAARLAMNLAAENIANAETTRVNGSNQAYQRKFPVMVEGKKGVEVSALANDTAEPVWVYDPTHPHANAYGFVAKPNIDLSSELIRLNYYGNWLQANVAVAKKTKAMRDSVLELTR